MTNLLFRFLALYLAVAKATPTTCGDIKTKFTDGACCGDSATKVVETGFDPVQITALHAHSANWTSSGYVFKLRIPLPVIARASQYGLAAGGLLDTSIDAELGISGLYKDGVKIATATMAIDPILNGIDANGMAYVAVGPLWLLTGLNGTESYDVAHPLLTGVSGPQHFVLSYAAVVRFDASGSFIKAFGKGKFHIDPSSLHYDGIHALRTMYMRQILVGTSATGVARVDYDFVEAPSTFPLSDYATELKFGSSDALVALCCAL